MPDIDTFTWQSWPGLAIAVAIALGIVIIVTGMLALAARIASRKWAGAYATFGPPRRRLRILLALIGTWIAFSLTLPPDVVEAGWRPAINQTFRILVILAAAWFTTAIVQLMFERVLRRYDVTVDDNRVARRMQTQLRLIRRVVVVVIGLLAVAAALLTFPGAQAAGASLLASAGLASVIAGLAAQSTLANVFAGMQLAFSDAIRLDDVVVVEGEFGRVEEITLTYVVVRIWDQRRLVLPSTYFTTTPFANWTRSASELMGTVELDVDWRVDVDAMRAELTHIVEASPLWDERVASIAVTSAVGGYVRVRPLVSARNSSDLWDLQILVREKLVDWVRREAPEALPTQRVEVGEVAAGADLGADRDARGRSRARGPVAGEAPADGDESAS
ncbi:small-conductance mechanosensitive channel [Microcella putealis]|uniref:Small-conductance mechanosensitive channel n=1 Tax=Microcella putealis TaxID=337005 RepID=A0A4Q7LNX9_9MICO|nr:mechanosensitive ion channel domain-containing protein [Microcella putealis]RZS56111.1 small-conductance mechanosensitive channel [Microcella putealis]TQM23458.1 small-conductance mechanosensitive channel [Microcella putealis]